ncbi:hypothetical protein XENOCAPTIV_029593, partial [Xenoophorus captivus]
ENTSHVKTFLICVMCQGEYTHVFCLWPLTAVRCNALAEMSVKAFELVPAVERDLLMGEKARINIECIECCGKHLYVGTNDCFIHHFLLDEVTSSKGKLSYSAQKLLQKYLGLKKPVAELRAASALERLIVLCDGIVFLIDMVTLESVPSAAGGGVKIRGVTAFCVNENPVNGDPFCVEMAVLSSKRRTVQIYMVYEDRVQLIKEVNSPEQPCVVSIDGYFLCLALTTQYMILNYNTGTSQDLFPYNSEERRPIVKRISREEFLLAAPGGLGMFANSEGASQRAPVNWSESVIAAAVCFPYVRSTDVVNGCRDDVDTALLKLYAEQDHDSLLDLLASDNSCVLTDSIPWLEKYHKYILHLGCSIILMVRMQQHYRFVYLHFSKARICTRSSNFSLSLLAVDSHCRRRTTGLYKIGSVRVHCGLSLLLFQYEDGVETGVHIFTKRPVSKGRPEVNPDEVITYLGKHSQALLLYLEHLVLERKTQKEKFHTHLALLYLDRVMLLLSESPTDEGQLTKAREKLQAMLRESSLYRVQFVLGETNIQRCSET